MTYSSNNGAQISERAWNFPPHSSITYKGNFGTPGSAYSLETGCKSFVDEHGNNVIAQFKFESSNNNVTIKCNNTLLSQDQVTASCSSVEFELKGDVNFTISNIGNVHLIGVDCDAGI